MLAVKFYLLTFSNNLSKSYQDSSNVRLNGYLSVFPKDRKRGFKNDLDPYHADGNDEKENFDIIWKIYKK